MKEHPIIFNGEMVRAILDGRKTQTRRQVKDYQQPKLDGDGEWFSIAQRDPRWGFGVSGKSENECANNLAESGCCPFGRIGDRLWVRETWRQFSSSDECGCSESPCNCPRNGTFLFKASHDDSESKWKPSIHMPRSACRIILEITNVRVERLQDISEQDACAEGVSQLHGGFWKHYQPGWTQHQLSARGSFVTLWSSIYGADFWSSNPWVWVIEFKVLTTNGVIGEAA